MRLIITHTAKALNFSLARMEYERQEVRSNGKTRAAKKLDLDKFEKFLRRRCGDDMPLLLDVTRASIEDFIEARLKLEAPSTVQRRLATIKHFCRKMAEQLRDFRNPASGVGGPRVDRVSPPKLTERQKTLLRSSVQNSSRCEIAARNAIILELGLLQGLRCQEMADLCLVHVNIEQGLLLQFRGKGTKFSTAKLHPRLINMMRSYNNFREELLTRRLPHYTELPEVVRLQFPYLISLTGADERDIRTFGMNPKTIWRVVTEAASRVGVECWTHKLRHTAIKDFYQASEKDMYRTAKYARHSNVNTTMIYAESSMEEVGETLERMA